MATPCDYKFSCADVKKLKSLPEAVRFAKKHRIDCGQLTNIEDVTDLLCSKIVENQDSSKQKDVVNRIKNILCEGKKIREKLQELYIELKKVVALSSGDCLEIFKSTASIVALDGQMLKLDLLSQIDQILMELKNNQSSILITGETSAGKSSLLNLILGVEILPHQHLTCTSVICILRNSDKEMAVVYDMDGEKKQIVPLSGLAIEKCRDKIKQLVVSTDRQEVLHSRVEIYWNFPLLQEDIFIVDSPGIGENARQNKVVFDYLPQAAAFVYVLNAQNAGGVQDDRIGEVLKHAYCKENRFKKFQIFRPETAIFLFNKWEKVPDRDKKQVKEDGLKRLDRYWPGLDKTKQVFFLSVETTAARLKEKLSPPQEYADFLHALEDLIPKSQNKRIMNYEGWLRFVVANAIHLISARINHSKKSANDRVQSAKRKSEKLKHINQQATDLANEFSEKLDKKRKEISIKVCEYLRTEDVKKELMNWSERDCPAVRDGEDCIRKVPPMIDRRIMDKMQDVNYLFTAAKEELSPYSQEAYSLINSLQGLDVDVENEETESSDDSFYFYPKNLFEKIAAFPKWCFNFLIEFIRNKTQVNRYNDNCVKYMKDLMVDSIEAYADPKILHPVFDDFFSDFTEQMKEMKRLLPRMIEAEKQIMNLVDDDTRNVVADLDNLERVTENLKQIRWKNYVLNIKEFKSEFSLTYDMECIDYGNKTLLGSGSFGNVYKVSFKGMSGKERLVAIKEMKTKLKCEQPEEPCDVFHEVEMLQQLQTPVCHKNILEFIGMIYNKQNETMIIITELCNDVLTSVTSNCNEKSPASLKNLEQIECFRIRSKYAMQIADGLKYIYEKGVVHRDLKPDNILLTTNGTIKIADVGLAKNLDTITGTMCGTPFYLAPEILNGIPYGCKADIYSFGLILYELWHGERFLSGAAYSQIRRGIVIGGPLPDFTRTAIPCKRWLELMKRCLVFDPPSERPNAKECLEVLEKVDRDIDRNEWKN